MTTIVAVETSDGVVFASDSRVGGGNINDGWVEKVFRNGETVWGVTGYLRVSQIVQYMDLPELPKSRDTQKLDKWVSQKLGPAFTKANDDYAAGDAKSARYSEALVAIRGRVYELGPSGDWTRRTSGCYAVGSGERYALGALAAGASAKQAIKIASIYDPGTNNQVRKIVIPNKA